MNLLTFHAWSFGKTKLKFESVFKLLILFLFLKHLSEGGKKPGLKFICWIYFSLSFFIFILLGQRVYFADNSFVWCMCCRDMNHPSHLLEHIVSVMLKKRVNPFCSASTGIQSVLAFSRSAAVNIAIQRISLASLYACKASLSANASADSGSVLSLLNEKVLMDSPYGNGESTLRFLRVWWCDYGWKQRYVCQHISVFRMIKLSGRSLSAEVLSRSGERLTWR